MEYVSVHRDGHAPVAEQRVQGRSFQLRDICLQADVVGPADGLPVLFLPGSGQTRAAWSRAINVVAELGFHAVSIDLRGHGDSEWSRDGCYTVDCFVDDFAEVCAQLTRPPVLIGASLGGIIGMLLAGHSPVPIAGLVLVDIIPRVHMGGSGQVRAFMLGAPSGFASLDEAADAVAKYLPHRARPRDSSGLLKNLRLRDGRYHWHWDPNFVTAFDRETPAGVTARLYHALIGIDIPIMLIRGALSKLVTMSGVDEFLGAVPNAEFVEVAGADHMVAGDSNQPFNDAVVEFLERHRTRFDGERQQAPAQT